MVNVILLNEKIEEAGLLKKTLAKNIGVDYLTFYKKSHNKSEFKVGEMFKIAGALGLTLEEINNIFNMKEVQ